MGLEAGTYVDDLNSANPLGTDTKDKGDDHFRLIKSVLKATFPGMTGAAWRVQAKSGAYTVVAGDNMSVINCTAALTLTLTAAATLGNQHLFVAHANGGLVTIDPNGAETINGAATLAVADGSTAIVVCNGTLFRAFVIPTVLTAAALTLLDDASTGAMLTTLGAQADLAVPSQAEAEAGTATTERVWTAQRVGQAIAALSSSSIGKHGIWVPAKAMRPTVSNGCASLASVETTAGRPDMQVLDFDGAADEHAQFDLVLGNAWNAGTVTFQAYHTIASAVVTGVAWALQGVSVANDETIDVAYGTAVVVTDTYLNAAEDEHITAESAAVTLGGTVADLNHLYFRVFRDVSDAADDTAADARLLGIMLFVTTAAGTDA